MKPVLFAAACMISFLLEAQTGPPATTIHANLFLPAHVLKGIPAGQPLVLHYVAEDANGKWETGKLTAKKVKENTYSFALKNAMYFRLVFVTGEYSYNMMCVNNREGTASDDYTFNILLEKRKFDPKELNLIAPCILSDE